MTAPSQAAQLIFGSAVLLFWGWQVHLLPLAVVMAGLGLLSLRVTWRWHLTASDFNRVADLCLWLVIGAFIYQYNVQRSIQALLTVTQLLPAIGFLLWATQLYSQAQTINQSALFWRIRRQVRKKIRPEPAPLDISLPYLALSLLSASTANQHTLGFFLGFAGLLASGLWWVRERSVPPWRWLSMVVMAIGLGYVGQLQLHQLQLQLEERIVAWFEALLWQGERDPYQQSTAIGQISELKTSNRIRFRVQQRFPRQVLLREASYNSYYQGVWRVKQGAFKPLSMGAEGTWHFSTPPIKITEQSHLQINTPLAQGKGILALPAGVIQLTELPVDSLQQHPLGAVKVEQGPTHLRYQVYYDPQRIMDSPPQDEDLYLGAAQQALLQPLLAALNLTPSMPPTQAVQAVGQFFASHFRYSLKTRAATDPEAALREFLVNSRQGHCEYFATATALLLRAAGIPSRYVSGYAVQEYSELENLQIVRQRHAHAWVQAYWAGTWHELDTTPAVWAETEAEQSPWWQGMMDGWDRVLFYGYQWLVFGDKRQQNQGLLLLLGLLLVFLIARLSRHPRIQQLITRPPQSVAYPGQDSPFYAIVQHLKQHAAEPLPGETLSLWIHRLSHLPMLAIGSKLPELLELLRLHDRYRFDPDGLTAAQHQRLTQGTQQWLMTTPPR